MSSAQSFGQQSQSLFQVLRLDVLAKLQAASSRMSLAQVHAAFDRLYTPDQLRAALNGLERDRKIDSEKDAKNASLYGVIDRAYAAQAPTPSPPTAQEIAARIAKLSSGRAQAATPPAVSQAKSEAEPQLQPEQPMSKLPRAGHGETRARVKKLLDNKPDITPAELAEKLDMSQATIRYHLKMIQEAEDAPAKAKPGPKPKEKKRASDKPEARTFTAITDVQAGSLSAAQFAFWNNGELQIEARGGLVRLDLSDRVALQQFLQQLPEA